MSDDSDLLIAAAATAAVFTWVGMRRSPPRAGATPPWRVLLRAFAAGLVRCWRETPAYQFVQGIRDLFSRRR